MKKNKKNKKNKYNYEVKPEMNLHSVEKREKIYHYEREHSGPLRAGSIIPDKRELYVYEKYEIIKPLGRGGMSQVYLGKGTNGRLYAIKEIIDRTSPDKEWIFNAFSREAEILSILSHPGLPIFNGKFKYMGYLYIIMEYVEGETLEDIIQSRGKSLDEKKVLHWGIQLCEIFFYLHTQKEPVIYRDLKPGNIIITKNDMVRLIDFGVARYYDPEKNSDTTRLGTPGYAAPEQYGNRRQSIPQSDIYTLGVILHQLITGYDPTVTPLKLPKIRTLNDNISEELEWIVSKAINYEPKDRYLDMAQFRDELIEYYQEYFGVYSSPYANILPYVSEKKGNILDLLLSAKAIVMFLITLWMQQSVPFRFLFLLFMLIIIFFILGLPAHITFLFFIIACGIYYVLVIDSNRGKYE